MMMGWGKVIAAALMLVSPQVCLPGSLSVVINEVLYDPEGKDAGKEFVELYNVSDEDICLHGYDMATGNGAYPERWTAEWEGAHADTIRAGGFFVIGEEAVIPTPDFIAPLDLQNGPDACKLTSPRHDVDLVGWGSHAFDEYYEGRPAGGSGSGLSLGREPDGMDTNDNSVDFTAFPIPSPGDFNHPPFDIGIEKACLSRYAQADHPTIQVISCLVNLGTAASGAGAEVYLACRGFTDSTRLQADIEPGASERLALEVPNVGEGLHDALVWLSWPEDRCHANDTLRTSLLIWPAPVVINEFMFKPNAGDCEWVELLNASASVVSMEGWTLEDSGGRRRPIGWLGPGLYPGDFLLLVEDESDFTAAHPGLDCPAVKPSGGWPTLNDTEGRDGYADMVVIRDAFGTRVDSVAYRKEWTESGRSVERIGARAQSAVASNWSPHYGASGSSPGRANSVSVMFPEPRGHLSLDPQTFSPDGDGTDDLLSVSVDLPAPAVVRLRVFDINGRAFTTLLDGDLVEERRVTFWDGRLVDGDIAPIGVYVILLEAKPVEGGRVITSRLPVVLVRR